MSGPQPYGMHYLDGAIDCHVHACPHLNARSADVFQAVRAAAAASMRAIGLMDNFHNSSGFAALAMRELGDLDVEVFGGVILQPVAGGVTVEAARTAIGYGYGPGTGARFVSMPTHHTRWVAEKEKRSPAYLETTFSVDPDGPLSDTVAGIMDLCAEHDVVFDCGHVSGPEAVKLCEEGKARGLTRMRTHCARYDPAVIEAIVGTGAYCEFSFFLLTHATQIGLTHVDEEKHRIAGETIHNLAPRIRAAGDRSIVSSDAGVYLLAPPVEAFREYMLMLEGGGFSYDEIRRMNTDNPATLFRVGEGRAHG